MDDPVVGPGPLSHAELRAWADAQPVPPKDARRSRLTEEQRRERRNAGMREVMKRKRQDPVWQARERKAQKARDTARRRLAAAFPDDYLNLVNDERIKRGLPVLERRKRRAPVTSQIDQAEDDKREKDIDQRVAMLFGEVKDGVDPKMCPHNMGLDKFSYGKFCKLCRKMIK